MIQCFNCEDWFHNTHLMPPETSTSIDDNYFLVCRTCINKTPGFRQALLEYKEYFYPSLREFLDNKKAKTEVEVPSEKSADKEEVKDGEEEPPQKRQKVGEDAADPMDFDVIIDDSLVSAIKEEHKGVLAKVIKMIETMANLDEEDDEL